MALAADITGREYGRLPSGWVRYEASVTCREAPLEPVARVQHFDAGWRELEAHGG